MAVLFLPITAAMAQRPADLLPAERLDIRHSRATGGVTFLAGEGGRPIMVQPPAPQRRLEPVEALTRFGRHFGIRDAARELTFQRGADDHLGQSHTTYQQVYQGVPVFSGILKVHQDAAGSVLAINGRFYPLKGPIDPEPTLTLEAASAVVRAAIEAQDVHVRSKGLVLVDPGWYGDPSAGVHLAWHLEAHDDIGHLHEAFFIDAHGGKMLDRWSLRHAAKYREIYDGQQTRDLPGELARAEGDDPVDEPEDVNRAYDYYGDTYDYFFRAFGRDGIDDAGLTMVATVNSRAPSCPNAFWSRVRLQMVFCDGTVTDDIVAHELMHGVTSFTANLIYQNQPGQLNESYSDIFGELVDLFNGNAAFVVMEDVQPLVWADHPTGPGLDRPNRRRTACSPASEGYPDGVRWLIGEDATVFGGAIRDMWDPTCRNHPDHANSPLQVCNPFDAGGVHSGSGIPNHAFAMLTDGKTFNGFTVTGIGPIKAAAVWYRALTVYLTIASDFQDAYVALNRAAQDLIGTYPLDPRTGLPSFDMFTAFDAAQVDLSLRAVEMDTPGRCGQTHPVLQPGALEPCANRRLLFAEDFESHPHGWTVFNSGPPTPYDWVLTDEPLPFGRDGRAMFCDNPSIGDCNKQDETALHTLLSPPIELPADESFFFLRFTHYLATERGWDGGTLTIRVNDGDWQALESRDFAFNPFNSIIRSTAYGNTNPLAGQEGWTGVGGGWGTSVVDLSKRVSPGDTIELRFDFGKDGCTGLTGWFVDDVQVYACPDCNFNDIPDQRELFYTFSSNPQHTIGVGHPRQVTVHNPPPAASDVTLLVHAIADLAFVEENIRIDLNGVTIGRVFELAADDCPRTPDIATLVVPAATFNELVDGGDAVFDFVATPDVNATLCLGGTFVKLFLSYAPEANDVDGDGVPDECQGCQRSDAPRAVVPEIVRNRYLAFLPPTTDRHLALRVTMTAAPNDHKSLVRESRWVGPPKPIHGPVPSDAAPLVAALRCSPYFAAWDDQRGLRVYGDFVFPGAVYEVEAFDLGCYQFAPQKGRSDGLTMATSLWGDVVGKTENDPPDGIVDMIDVTAVVNRFGVQREAPALTRADLAPAVPDQVIDFRDIRAVVDAFKEAPYAYPAGGDCP